MTEEKKAVLSARLMSLGMRLEGDRLDRAAQIVRAHGGAEQISDMALLSICVEAYRHPEKETLQVV